MRNLNELDKYRIKHPFGWDGPTSGTFKVFVDGRSFMVIASVDDCGADGLMEHISVTPKNQKRCPTWEEMAAIKDMFFLPEEECVQFHPKHSEYVNYHHFCLHIWRPVNGSLKQPHMATGGMTTLAYRDAQLEELWAQFGDVPMDPDTEQIEGDFLHFPHGTDREEIWHWFDERHSKGVAYLLYRDGFDRTDEMSKLYHLKQLCQECEGHGCTYNHGGECRFALVHERKPEINDIDGCVDYDYAEESD